MSLSSLSVPRPGPFLRWPVITSIVSVTAIMAIAVGLVLDARREIEVRTRETTGNLLRAIQRDISRNIETLDLSLSAVSDGLARPDVMALDPELRNLVLFDRSATASGVGALLVFDEHGVLRIDSASIKIPVIAPITDREHFRVHERAARSADDVGLFVSRPYRSRVLGTEVVSLSRRLSRPNGAFAGIVLASIQISYLRDLFTTLSLAPGGVVLLARTDGAVILRMDGSDIRTDGDFSSSPIFRAMGDVRAGDSVGTSTIDGIERVFSFAQLDGAPLLLSIGIPTTSIYGDWAQKSALVLGALALISAVLVALCILVARELERRSDAEARLVAANAELERLSATDALTGLGNRRSYDQALAREARRAARTHRKLSLVLVDVDHFKLFNDRYGHPKGDAALRTVADILQDTTRRPGDTVYRIGGEEFAVLLPDTGAEGAVVIMEAIRRTLVSLDLPHEASPRGRLTVSQGCSEVFNDDMESAVERADSALYRAKRDGRDRAYVEVIRAAA